jgi:hypothetical protein
MKESELTPRLISNALVGLRKMSGKAPETRLVLGAILAKMGSVADASAGQAAATSEEPQRYTSLDISRSMSGILNMSVDSCPEAKALLVALTALIRRDLKYMTPDDAGFTLFGLKAQTEKSAEVRAALSVIREKLSKAPSSEPMKAKAISMLMQGLQGMSSDVEEVTDLLKQITPRIGEFDAQACGNVLYSLKRMTSDQKAVRVLLQTIAPKIESCSQKLSAQELANAFFGLQGLDSKFPEVRNIVKALTKKLVQAGDVKFSSQGIGNAISGFQSMEDCPEVIEALGLLGEKLEACDQVMPPMDLANALFGLQGVTSGSVEVRALLIALAEKMRQSEGIYSARDIGYSLAGLSTMQTSGDDIVREVFEELCVKVAASEFKGQPNLLFMQFGKGVKVKRGDSPFTMSNAESLVAQKVIRR